MKRVLIGYNEKFIYDVLIMIFGNIEGVEVIDGVRIEKLKDCLDNYSFDILFFELGPISEKEAKYVISINELIREKSLFIFSSNIHPRSVSRIMETQPDGFLLKSCSKSDLITAINNVVNGRSYYCPKITKLLYADLVDTRNSDTTVLTPKEKAVISYLVDGETNMQIASILDISETTVKTHRKNIMRKLSVTNSFELIRYACRENLIDHRNSDFCSDCPCRN